MKVVGIGSRGPLGLSSVQVAMCARARKLEPRALRHLKDRHGAEIGACLSGGLSIHQYGYDRMVALAAPAATEAVAAYRASGFDEPLPLIMSYPERGRADDDPRFEESFIEALGTRSGIEFDLDSCSAVRCGHAGAAFALERAQALLDGGKRAVLVGGVDSYYHPGVLRALDESFRLHSSEAEDGFIPSESAAFAVLTGPGALSSKAPGGKLEALATIACVATSLEAGAVDPDGGEPNIGAAVTELIDRAAEHAPVDWVLTDVNGERHRVREWTLVQVRSQLRGVERVLCDLGDIGAASGATLLNIACEYWRVGCAPTERVTVVLASDGPERGMFVVEATA